jgi:hypothetical protein
MSSLGDERAVCRAGSINRLKADLRGDAQQCVEADALPGLPTRRTPDSPTYPIE